MKINRRTVEAISDQYKQLPTVYEPENVHEQLLFECALDFSDKLQKLLTKKQKKFTVEFSGAEALAFCLLWKIVPITHYGCGMAINSVVAGIDQARKSPTRLIPEIL